MPETVLDADPDVLVPLPIPVPVAALFDVEAGVEAVLEVVVEEDEEEVEFASVPETDGSTVSLPTTVVLLRSRVSVWIVRTPVSEVDPDGVLAVEVVPDREGSGGDVWMVYTGSVVPCPYVGVMVKAARPRIYSIVLARMVLSKLRLLLEG
jgi:hypothetical protein